MSGKGDEEHVRFGVKGKTGAGTGRIYTSLKIILIYNLKSLAMKPMSRNSRFP